MRALLIFVLAATASVLAGHEYTVNEANGVGYKIMYQSETWGKAKELCELEGAKLAIPKSQEEFQFIQRLVRGIHYPDITGTDYKLLAWLGINNLDSYKIWKNIDGENIENTGFHTWASQMNGEGYSDDPAEPHCVGLDAANFGLRSYWCHRRQPYICQKSF